MLLHSALSVEIKMFSYRRKWTAKSDGRSRVRTLENEGANNKIKINNRTSISMECHACINQSLMSNFYLK